MTHRGTMVIDVFLTIAAQEDNLGDVAIRQQMVNLVTADRTRLHISRGAMSDEYVDAFDFPAGADMYRTRRNQLVQLLRSTARGRAVILFPPGPYPVTSIRAGLRSLASVGLSLLVRARGGFSMTIGKSIRGTNLIACGVEKALVFSSNLYVARDLVSSSVLNRPIRHAPDLALLDAIASTPGPSRFVAVSLRSDRSVDKKLLHRVAEWADDHGLTLAFVTQVRRDDDQHRQLASEIGGVLVDWGERTHREQMIRVQETYCKAAIVVTDRLHAALFGAIAGAVPIGLVVNGEPSKIRDAFEDVLPFFPLERSEMASLGVLDDAIRAVAEVRAATWRSADELKAIKEEVHGYLRS